MPDPEPESKPKPEPGQAWEKPASSLLGQLIDQIADALPHGPEDFELTFADVFARPLSRSHSTASSEILRRFAASLLVRDEVTLEHYFADDHSALLESFAREELLSRDDASMWERLENLSLADVFQQGRHGYALVQAQYPDVLGKVLLAFDDPTTLAKQFDKTDFSGIAALDWLQGRILGRWEAR